MSRNNTHTVQKLAVAGVLTAVAVVGSFLSVPVAGSKCGTRTAYGQCICRCSSWTMVGNRHRILCKPDP